jgi:hypothetical protein
MFNKQKFAFNVAFPYKYVAVNDLTNREVKRFRTLRGAKRWYNRPVVMLGIEISKAAMFISIYEIEDPIGYLATIVDELVEERRDAFQVMKDYAQADIEATSAMFNGYNPRVMILDEAMTVEPYEPVDDRCGRTTCLYCYGTQAEYEAGEFFNEVPDDLPDYPIAQGDEQPTLPDMPVEPMPHWERELLSVTGEYERCSDTCEDCDNIVANREAQAKAQEESEAALQLLREKLGAQIIPDFEIVQTHVNAEDGSCKTCQDDLEVAVFIKNEDYWAQQIPMLLKKRDLVQGVQIGDAYYRLTSDAVAALGTFYPAGSGEAVEAAFEAQIKASPSYQRGLELSEPLTDEERAQRLSDKQAQEFAIGLAKGPSDLTGLAAREASKSE